MNVLLIGGSGQLGQEIRVRWTGHDVFAPSHAQAPIEDLARVEDWIERSQAAVVVNCAAFHNVDVCETQSDQAFAINALAVDRIAALCERRGIVFVTISTDYVFDGNANEPYSESDCTNPISCYGASKRAGESLVLRRSMKAFVVRTCGVYGRFASKSKGTFVDRIIKQAREGQAIRVVSDVVASPTYAGHLADALGKLVLTAEYGLYHACNNGPVSWFAFAQAVLQHAGIDYPIEAIAASDWKAAARRPVYSALSSAKLERVGIVMPSWTDGIAAYLQDVAR
ncbi:MAG TPA: dTDP-4-dehydrorhamnose reductase [Candidatus Aquilonibacter sp.]|nr:dTDP-4-dehydrorhamnose reductase [Candidatus Aquilonibacter sp.]